MLYPGLEAVLVATLVATVTDIRRRKIPNWLTGSLAIVAVVCAAFEGLGAVEISVLSLVGMVLLGFVAFSFGWLGGGDVKLLAAAVAALHLHDILLFLIATSIGGGIFAMAVAVVQGRLFGTLRSVFLVVRPAIYRGTVAQAPVEPIKLPYAVPIAIGALVVALSLTVAPFLRLSL